MESHFRRLVDRASADPDGLGPVESAGLLLCLPHRPGVCRANQQPALAQVEEGNGQLVAGQSAPHRTRVADDSRQVVYVGGALLGAFMSAKGSKTYGDVDGEWLNQCAP